MQVRTGVQAFGATGFRQAIPATQVLGNNRRRPSYRQTYKPPMLAAARKGPQLSGEMNIPNALGFGAFGVGAILLSQIIPPPIKTIAQVVGVGLVAFGITELFPSEAEAAPVTGEQAEPSIRTQIADPGMFSLITGSFDSPKWGADVKTGFGYSYQVTISLSNPAESSVPVRVKIFADEQRIGGLENYRSSNLLVQDSMIIPAFSTETKAYDVALFTADILQYVLWAQYAVTLKLIIERQAGLTGVENVRELSQIRFQAQ